LENKSYDFRFKLRGPVPVSVNQALARESLDSEKEFSDNIVIVPVDEESVELFGRWPWPRIIIII